MTEEYPELVLSTYKKMRDNGELHTIIPKATTAALKNACLKVYDSRYNPEDADILSVFFNVDKMKCDFRKVISDVKSDYFKALWKHIRDKTDTTDERNSDLLAWLIDFKPRPSGSYYKSLREAKKRTKESNEGLIITSSDGNSDSNGEDIPTDKGDDSLNGESDKNDGLEKETKEKIESLNTSEPIGEIEINGEKELVDKPTVPPVIIIPVKINDGDKGADKTRDIHPPKEPIYEPRFSPRYIIISCVLIFFIGSTSFMVWERMPISVRKPDVGENAMYWDGDHYEPVKAGAQKPGVAIIPLDFTLLQQQRKITLPDTLTKYSLGKVWYKGYGSNHEYFTFKGIYPADTARTLKPLSTTILTKYTSNYRYYFTRLLWFLCAAFVISIGGYLVSTLKKEVKHAKEEGEPDRIPILPDRQFA